MLQKIDQPKACVVDFLSYFLVKKLRAIIARKFLKMMRLIYCSFFIMQ